MIAGIVLAGGGSTRLGRPKQLLPLGGQPLLRYTVQRVLASTLDAVIVIVGPRAEPISEALGGLPIQVVVNPHAAEGQSSSVIAGLLALDAMSLPHDDPAPPTGARESDGSPSPSREVEAAIFLLGDQPGVDPAVIDALITRWRETGAPVVAPRYADGIGNPILFARRVFPNLRALRGDVGARRIVRDYKGRGELVLVPVGRPAPPDVDTEADYAALIATFAQAEERAAE